MTQTLRLGLAGSEVTLTGKSRIVESVGTEESHVDGRSADNTLHRDFKPTKRTFTITWDVLSETDYNTIKSIYDDQYTNASFLSFYFGRSDTGEDNYTVTMSPPNYGPRTYQDVWYYGAVSIVLNEV